MSTRILIVALFLFLSYEGISQETYRIFGEIHSPTRNGIIYIYLIDYECFNIPSYGIDTVVIDVNSDKANYTFTSVNKGVYGIRCFQDLNGNMKLDKGLFGPTEPWALTWKGKKRFPPKFEDISFELRTNKRVDLILNK